MLFKINNSRIAIFAILSCSLVSYYRVSGQIKRDLDWQDFKNSVQTTDVAEPVRYGSLTVFQITNINKFLYRVTIAGRVFELQTPMPSELQALFRLTPAELQKSVTNTKAVEAESQTQQVSDKVSQQYETIKAGRNESESEGPTEEALKKLREEHTLFLSKLRKVSANILILKRARAQLISMAQRDISASDMQVEVYKVNLPGSIESDYSDFKDQLDKTMIAADLAKSGAESGSNVGNLIDAVIASLRKSAALIDEEALLATIDDVGYLYAELQDANNYIVVAPPVQMDGDVISYEVTITPTSTRALGPYRNPMKFTFDVPAKGGIKVDFSIGPALSFGGNSKDEKYYLEPINSDSVVLRARKNNNSIAPSIAAFMHIYPHSGKSMSIGGLLGIGAGFQNSNTVNANLFFGVTAVMGKRQKVMLSSGVSYLKVQRIKNNEFKEGGFYTASTMNLTNVTESVYKPSFFIGLSYNLANRTEISH